MDATVVIPTYERPSKLRATVESVCEQTVSDYAVVVVDDGSDSAEQATVLGEIEEWEGVTTLEQENGGPAAARNRGWRSTSNEVVLFTDDDCIVPPDWVERIVEGFEPGVGAVGGPLVPNEEALAESVFARLHRFRDAEVYGKPDEPIVGGAELPMGATANVAYRREALEAVDGFDESFPTAAGEDADLQQRVVDEGYRMKYVPTSVTHNEEYSACSFASRAIRHGSGTFYFQQAHESPRPVWRVLVGLVASPVHIVFGLRRGATLPVAAAYAVERGLARYGELRAHLNERG